MAMSCLLSYIQATTSHRPRMIQPTSGMSFILEDKQQAVKEGSSLAGMGFEATTDRLAGVTGVIYAINTEKDCPKCGHSYDHLNLKAGDRVIYSKFVAEQIEYEAEDIPKGRLRSVPVDAILATIV